MRIRHLAAAAVLAAAVLALATCSNPVDLVEAATVEVMKANDRYLEVVSTTPVNNATGVNPGSRILLVLDRDIASESLDASTFQIRKNSDNSIVSWLSFYDDSTKTLSIRPTPYLLDTTAYTVTVNGIRGSDGSDLLESLSWGFTTGVAPAGGVSITTASGENGFTTIRDITVTVTPNAYADEYLVSLTELDPDNPTGGTGWINISTPSTSVQLADTQGEQVLYTAFRGEISGSTAFSVIYVPSIIYDSVAPAAPSVSGTTPTTDRTPTWSWSSGGGGIGTYRYQLDGTAGAWTTTSSTSYTPGTDIALGNHTLYVQERDEAGNWSSNGSRIIGIAPLAPTGVAASDNTSTSYVAVTWTAPSGVITSYYIDRATSSTGTYTNIGTSATTSYNDTSASPGSVYYYKVRAVGGGYTSTSSSYDAGYRKLSTPGSISATDSTNTSYVTISWGSVTGSTTYYVYRATSSGGTYSSIGSSTGTAYNDTTGTPGTTYFYKIRAYANGYYSDYSTYDSGLRKLTAPTGVSASDGTSSTGITVSWTAVTGAASYQVYRSTTYNGTYSAVGGLTASTSYSDTDAGLTVSTNYYYEVRAYASGYYSDYSTYNAGYKGLPTVTGLTASTNLTSNAVKLAWTAVSGATGYQIYRSSTYNGTYDYLGYTSATIYNNAPPSFETYYYYKVRPYSNSSFPGVWSTYVSGKILGITGYWTFNSSWSDSGLADSKYDHFSITSGTPSFSSTRVVGTYSAWFSTYSEKVTSSGHTFMSSDRKKVSVSYWVYPTKLSSGLMWAIECTDFNVGFSGSEVTMTISLPSTNSAKTTLSTGQWYHIVGTYDGTYIRIYKNGALAASTYHPGVVSSSTDYLYINSGTSTNYWTGYIDDLRIYNVVLSSSQVLALYNLQ